MSTTYMVKSTLVFLSCHINIVLMTLLFLLNSSESTQQYCILSVLQKSTYVLGLFFNVYVILYASRKWELVLKYLENGTNYMSLMQKEIKLNILNSLQASVQQIMIAANSILEAFTLSNPIGSNVVNQGILEENEPVTEKIEPAVAIPKVQKTSNFQEETIAKIQKRLIFKEEAVPKVQASSDEKTPELKAVYYLKRFNRPKSDPIKAVRNEVIKTQSPELLKNKIFKSRMNLT